MRPVGAGLVIVLGLVSVWTLAGGAAAGGYVLGIALGLVVLTLVESRPYP